MKTVQKVKEVKTEEIISGKDTNSKLWIGFSNKKHIVEAHTESGDIIDRRDLLYLKI
jgi:hypothetical protein